MAPASRLAEVCRLKGHEERVWCVAWRPNTEPPQLATCGSDRVIRLWGARAGAALDAQDAWRLLAEVDATERHSRTLRSVAWDPSGEVMAVASFDATTSLWRPARPGEDGEEAEAAEAGAGPRFQCVGLVAGHENEVKCAAFSPSGDYLATCSRDKSVWIFETEPNFEYECVAVLQSHTQDVKSLRWHPSQDVLFSASYDDTVKVWGPEGDDWSCKQTLTGHESTVWGLAFDPVGDRFVSASDDRSLRLFGVARPGESDSQEAASPVSLAMAAYATPLFRGALCRVKPGPDKPEEPRKAPADAACAWQCRGAVSDRHPRPVYAVDWAALGESNVDSVIATACGDDRVRVFQPSGQSPEKWACTAEVEAHAGDVNCVAWCPQALPGGAGLLASVGDDCEVALWRYAA